MRIKQRTILLSLTLTIVAISASCLGMKYNKWIGKNQTQLINRFGPPDRTASDGGNGRVLVYYDRTTSQAKYNPVQGGYVETNTPSVNFFVNSSGTITRWNVRK